MDEERSIWGGDSSAWSSSNEYVHIYAPGSDGLTTSSDGSYINYGGTSMAAPHVAGVAALLLSVNPALKASQIKSLILDNASTITIQLPITNSPIPQLPLIQDVNKLNAYEAVFASVTYINTDTTISNIIIDKPYFIKEGVTVTIDNVTFTPDVMASSQQFGFIVRGTLLIIDSHIVVPRGYLRSMGEEGEIIVSNSIIHFNKGFIESLDSGIISFNYNSEITITNGQICLDNRSSIIFNTSSKLVTIGSTKIIGHSYSYWVNESTFIPGDRIVFNTNSKIELGSGTTITSGSGDRWDGLYFIDNDPDSFSHADIEGV